MRRSAWLILVVASGWGCTVDTTGLGEDGEGGDAADDGNDDPADDGRGGTGEGGSGANTGAASPNGGGGNGGSGAGGSGGNGGSGAGGSGGAGGGGGSGGAGGCYSEAYNADASLTDLESGYSSANWLDTMLETLQRRYDNGFYVLDQMQDDPWLSNSFPQYFDLSSFAGMAEAIDTACHEETHGYDFDSALGTPGQHVYFMGQGQEVVAPKLDFFARNEIVGLVNQGGSVTSLYDGTYLTGEQGSYDFIFLADELTAYINGLACATAVADQLSNGHSYRDGAASHLLYLELYLRVARTNHPALYDSWRAEPTWQKFVRLAWARGQYWLSEAAGNPVLGIGDAAILARVNDPANVAEIAQFTGEDAATVACSP